MADNVYFIDSIYSPIGDDLSYVTFLPAEANSEQLPMVVAMNRNQMGLNGHRGDVKEGWYVIYDREAPDEKHLEQRME